MRISIRIVTIVIALILNYARLEPQNMAGSFASELQQTIIRTPKNGSTLRLNIPQNGTLYIMLRSGLRFNISNATFSPNLIMTGSWFNMSIRSTNNQPGSGRVSIALEDGRKVKLQLQSSATPVKSIYVIID